tara:strand:+ start:15987 stop:16412 length:426 start_codon:yes stop_codon:yes gene_type:complete
MTPRQRRLEERKRSAELFLERPWPIVNLFTEVVFDLTEEVHMLHQKERLDAFVVETVARVENAIANEDQIFTFYEPGNILVIVQAMSRLFLAECTKNPKSRRAPIDVLRGRMMLRTYRQPFGFVVRTERCIKWLRGMDRSS